MLYTDKNCLPENNSTPQTPPAGRTTARIYIHEFSAEDLKECILSTHELNYPLQELIATGEATFEFIRCTELELHTKNAFFLLERQFEFYKKLIELA
jgi:hypothetical protein